MAGNKAVLVARRRLGNKVGVSTYSSMVSRRNLWELAKVSNNDVGTIGQVHSKKAKIKIKIKKSEAIISTVELSGTLCLFFFCFFAFFSFFLAYFS